MMASGLIARSDPSPAMGKVLDRPQPSMRQRLPVAITTFCNPRIFPM